MATLVKNDKGFKIIKLNSEEAAKLSWGMTSNGDCLCMHCNKPIDFNEIYFIPVLNDTMDKECFEAWYKNAINYPEDRKYEERTFQRISEYLDLKE